MVPIPHEFQMNLFHRVRAARGRGARIIVVQGPTGCGKTVFAGYVVKQSVDLEKAVLCMVHRRKLVDQISATLEDYQINHGILMRGEPYDSSLRVQVASRDTLLSRCCRNEWVGLPPADLIIVDECHHLIDPESEYRRILANYPQATILLLSATPVGPNGEGLGPWAQAIECAAPMSQLIREGFLVPVKCYAPERKRKGNRYVKGIAGDLVQSWLDYGEGLPTVLFCSRVQHSLDAVEAFKAKDIPAAHMDADTPDERRDEIFDEVASGRIKILSNVGIVGEGVDVPKLGCCQLFCEVGSRVRFLQAIGRIMRRAPEKTHGVLIDHSGAIFKHGFPDEDTEWTLNGNVNENFAKKHALGETAKAFYCKKCELAYHGCSVCPQCGREPSKPPKSIFAPPPVRPRNELLTEVERNGHAVNVSLEEKIQHWFRCLSVAVKRNGPFTMASAIFKQKYGEWPGDDFPMLPSWDFRRRKVREVYPDFGRKKS